MTVQQIYGIMNDVTSEILGESALAKEDLSTLWTSVTQYLMQHQQKMQHEQSWTRSARSCL